MFLKKIYKKFWNFAKKDYFRNIKNFSTSLSNLKIPDKILEEFFENYEKLPFFSFLKRVKDLVYSQKISDFVLKNFTEDWDLWRYLKFLKDENLIEIKGDKIKIKNKILLKVLPEIQTENEIRKRIEKKLKIKIKSEDLVINLFKKDFNFFPKVEFDQMPISQGSAIFLVKKILDYLPIFGKFLFVGDDDFISVLLTLADPKIECKVCDIDERVLKNIVFLAKKYRLKIETQKVDFSKVKNLKEKFVGFLANPVYTEEGVKIFVKFGKENLGKDGGFGFLILGDESIGNRILSLQEFFTKENLVIFEKINGKIFYPQIQLYKEDQEISRRLSQYFDEKKLKKIPKIGATLFIFEYFPKEPKRIKFERSFYAYL